MDANDRAPGADPDPSPYDDQLDGQSGREPDAPVGSPSGASRQGGDSGGGGGCMKGLLGCGCVAAIALVVLLLVGGVVAWIQIPGAVGADSWSEVGQVAQMAERASRATGAAAREGEDPTAGEEPEQAARAFGEFFDTLERTSTTRTDMNRVSGVLADFDDSREVREFNEVYERVRAIEDEELSLQTLMNLRHLTRLAFRTNDLGRAYRDNVERQVGPEYRQTLTLARISRLGSPQDVEPWDQSVADALLRDHDENREDYLEARALIDRLMAEEVDPDDLTEEERARLAEAYADHVVLVTAAMNRESLVAWRQMSDDERREIIERLDTPHNWVARVSATILHGEPGEEHLMFLRLMGF